LRKRRSFAFPFFVENMWNRSTTPTSCAELFEKEQDILACFLSYSTIVIVRKTRIYRFTLV